MAKDEPSSKSYYIGDDTVRKMICGETGLCPSIFEPRDDVQRAAVTQALVALNRAVFDHLLIGDYLMRLRPELDALIASASAVRRRVSELLLTRDHGHRFMEEVAENIASDRELWSLVQCLRNDILGNPSAAREARVKYPDVARSAFEIVEDLLALVDARLLKLGEQPGRRGRPREQPAIDEAVSILSNAGMTTAEIQAAIGNEIAATRVQVQWTRNRQGYDTARDPKRAVRRSKSRPRGGAK